MTKINKTKELTTPVEIIVDGEIKCECDEPECTSVLYVDEELLIIENADGSLMSITLPEEFLLVRRIP